MLDKLTDQLGFQAKALVLRAERQRTLASNIANADTPGYVARDFDFRQAMGQALQTGGSTGPGLNLPDRGRTQAGHMALGSDPGGVQQMAYSTTAQPSLDRNTVDLDRERAAFVDNSVRYEAALRFINGQAKTLLSAIQGQ